MLYIQKSVTVSQKYIRYIGYILLKSVTFFSTRRLCKIANLLTIKRLHFVSIFKEPPQKKTKNFFVFSLLQKTAKILHGGSYYFNTKPGLLVANIVF